MRVSVYKMEDGTTPVMVEASVGAGKPPLVLQGLTKDNFRDEVFRAIEEQKRQAPVPEL